MALRRASDPWLRLTAVAVLAQHSLNLFFLPYPRYYYLTWLFTLLIVAVWLHDEGIALIRRRWPALCATGERIAHVPPGVRSNAARPHDRRLGRPAADGRPGGYLTRALRFVAAFATRGRRVRDAKRGSSIRP